MWKKISLSLLQWNLKLLAHIKINVNLILHFYNYQKSQVNNEIVCIYENQRLIFKSSFVNTYEVIYVYKK